MSFACFILLSRKYVVTNIKDDVMSSRLIFPKLLSLRNSSPKNENLLKMYSPSDHPKRRCVCFFIGKDFNKFSSEWVAEWENQNESSNVLIIHMTPVH